MNSLSSDRAFRFRDNISVLILAAGLLAVHLLCNWRYGFHRDELQVLDDARHLAWGYVAYPPLTAFLGRIELLLFGTSLDGFRFFSALAQSVAVVLAAAIAGELGGNRQARFIAAIATTVMPFSLLAGSEFMYVSFDFLWWVLLAWLVLRLINSANPRWWLAIGAVIGLGMLTRNTIGFCTLGLVAGVLATPLRAHLRSRWLWTGVALSVLIFLPNLIWQAQHDFVYLDFVRTIHARDMRWGRTDGFFPQQLFANASLFTAPIWLAGLWFVLRAKDDARYRILAWMYLVPLILFALAQGRGYYMAPAYPMLLAAGAVACERWLTPMQAARQRLAHGFQWLLLVFAGITGAAIALPIAPVNSLGWRISRAAHDNFAEQIGWQQFVRRVAEVYRSLPENERARTAILANNYGEAGAIDFYGPALGLPPAISRTNSYWYRGYGNPPPLTVIELGNSAQDEQRSAAKCTSFGRFHNSQRVDNEESASGYEIFVCRDIPPKWQEIWGTEPRFG
ncbi:MAG: glycosyltransferase family 39 protein [Xanthomonadaceae bacterium]|nr:glycosyltransferase family 39 protein [Xanthomonadaceae bacterium]MDE2084641.1 glycosyltransferase family 39 protein [Xanthomonadaceae bacterium]MDE2257561.1 glycosyltransferase family 39 protein [Xanthomonadaceae bacterium]